MTAGHPFFSASSLLPATLCCETENPSISYMCSVLYQKNHFVKRLEVRVHSGVRASASRMTLSLIVSLTLSVEVHV